MARRRAIARDRARTALGGGALRGPPEVGARERAPRRRPRPRGSTAAERRAERTAKPGGGRGSGGGFGPKAGEPSRGVCRV